MTRPTPRTFCKKAVKKALTTTLAAATLAAGLGLNAGCYTQRFDVGDGATLAAGPDGDMAPQSQQEFSQFFILYGLIPLTKIEADVEAATAGQENYTIVTQFTPLDVVINFFTGIATIGRKTVTVKQ